MKLYSRPLSPYSARVRIALYQKGLDFEHVVPEMGWSKDAVFLGINPLGRIPVLVLDDGTSLIESAAIVEYLDDAFPTPPMRPASASERARARAFTQLLDHEVLAPMMTVFMKNHLKQDATEAVASLVKGLGHTERMLEETLEVSIVDAMLTPVRFNLESLAKLANMPTLLDPFPKIVRYREKATSVASLARTWKEMEEGLVAFLAKHH